MPHSLAPRGRADYLLLGDEDGDLIVANLLPPPLTEQVWAVPEHRAIALALWWDDVKAWLRASFADPLPVQTYRALFPELTRRFYFHDLHAAPLIFRTREVRLETSGWRDPYPQDEEPPPWPGVVSWRPVGFDRGTRQWAVYRPVPRLP